MRTGGQPSWPWLSQSDLPFPPRRGRWFRPLHRCPKLAPCSSSPCKDSSRSMWLKRCVSHPHASGQTGAQSRRLGGRGAGAGKVQAPQAAGRECSPPGGVWVEGGSWNFEKPSPTLDSQFQPWASSLPLCQHRAVQGPGFAKRELWIAPSLTPGGVFWSGCCLVSAARWAVEAWTAARCRPR